MSNNIHINHFALKKGWQNMFNGSNMAVTNLLSLQYILCRKICCAVCSIEQDSNSQR
jgi:hypothetical protein